jgi:hypothetical protein
MKAPTYHLDIGSETAPAAACGKKKGLVMEKNKFMKQMKDGFDSLFLCDNCIRIAKSKKNGKA